MIFIDSLKNVTSMWKTVLEDMETLLENYLSVSSTKTNYNYKKKTHKGAEKW